MSLFKTNALSKGIMLMVTGLIIAFFPDVISKLVYIISISIIFFSSIRMIKSLIEDKSVSFILINSSGIFIGVIIMFLPSFIKIGIPLITGIILGSAGLDRIYTAVDLKRSGCSWIGKTVIGTIFLITALTIFIHPFRSSNVLRITIGLIIVVIGLINIFTHIYNKKDHKNTIIDIENNSIRYKKDIFLE